MDRRTLITHQNGTTVLTNARSEHVQHDCVVGGGGGGAGASVEEGEPPQQPAATPLPETESPLGLGPRDALSEPFEVSIGVEVSVDCLAAFLKRGGVTNIEDWDVDALPQLGHELSSGEATLGLDCRGVAKRVVSVVKPVLFDGEHLLVEAFQYFPSKNKVKVKCSGMSEKFSRAKESYYEASARAVVEELKLDVRYASSAQIGLPTRFVKRCVWNGPGVLANGFGLLVCLLQTRGLRAEPARRS